jgi:hypothetical protein
MLHAAYLTGGVCRTNIYLDDLTTSDRNFLFALFPPATIAFMHTVIKTALKIQSLLIDVTEESFHTKSAAPRK